MEEIFAIGREDEFNESDDVIELNQLSKLRLYHLPQLTSFCSKLKPPPMLEQRRDQSTTDRQSNEITSENDIFDTLFNGKVVLPNLEYLFLYEIKCEKIWHNQLGGTSCCVQNLTGLFVSNCDKLKSIFSSSMVRNLVQLQHLRISNCALLEEIVAQERGEELATTFVFPRVTSLSLWNLRQLRAFYPGLYTSEWPVLKDLTIDDELIEKIFNASDIHNIQDSNIQEQQQIVLVKKVFSNLKELEVSGKGCTMRWRGPFPQELFHKLKVVEMLLDKSTVIPLGLLQKLEKLTLKRNQFNEIFSYEQVDEQDRVVFQQLKYLQLDGLRDLQHLWKEESILQNLEDLNVMDCHNLIDLVPSSGSFQNLTTLYVQFCDGFLSLVTPFTAKTLSRLQDVLIISCKMMTEIVANEGGVAKDEIVFNELKELRLEYLESLTSFCSGNYTFNFPSLKELHVFNCPKMKIFCKGVLKAPRLQRLYINDKECWEGDLNTTIQHSFKKMNVGSCIEELGESSTQHQE